MCGIPVYVCILGIPHLQVHVQKFSHHEHTDTHNLRFSLYSLMPSLNCEPPVLSTLNPFCEILLAQCPSWLKFKGKNDIPCISPGLRK